MKRDAGRRLLKIHCLPFFAAVLLLNPLCFLPNTDVFAGQKPLTIAAASDLSFALKEISSQFEKDTGIRTALSFGSSGMISVQISNGAPFDIFFAAHEKYINELKSKGLIIPDTQQLYAIGRIVLASNKKTGHVLKTLHDLDNSSIKRIAIANPDHAPYGAAAKEAMIKSGVWDKLQHKIVYAENIRQALQFIQTGDAGAGIAALSIADVPEIKYTLIDDSLHNPIRQAAAITGSTKLEKEARAFMAYFNGPGPKAVLRKYGFILP